MPVIGLTGSIASGKSLVTRILKENGIAVIDADLVARDVVKPGLAAWKRIKETFGPGVINPDYTINRKKLGSMVFGNDGLMRKLNEITHPVITEEIFRQVREFRSRSESEKRLLVIDAPLLIETGLHNLVDQVWVVYVPEEVQIQRLMNRDGISREQAIKKIGSQMSTEQKKNYAQVVIDNSGSPRQTQAAVEALISDLLNGSGVDRIETE